MNLKDQLLDVRRRLIGHGALVLLFGSAVGFGFLFFLLGEITLWPIPGAIDYQMPGTYDAWRMAHVEGMINGFALWLAAAILPMVPASLKALRRIGNGMIVVAWTIVIASAFDPLLPASRGLAFGGSLTNTIAFLLFVVGIGIFLAAMVTIAWKSLRAPASSPN